jgi:hypothetical protein
MKTQKSLLFLLLLSLSLIQACSKENDHEPLNLSFQVKNLSSHLNHDGSIALEVKGGKGPYTYFWSDSVTTQNRENLKAGTYKVSVSDADSTQVTDSVKVTGPISIIYFGQSYFEIVSPEGVRIITDPSNIHLPGAIPRGKADLVTISHNHADHNTTSLVSGKPQIIQKVPASPIVFKDVEITGYLSKHGLYAGSKIDNIIFIFKMGNKIVAHLGENEKITEENILAGLKNADVLLAPVGEAASMSILDALDLWNLSDKNILVPQHYAYSESDNFYNSASIDDFINSIPGGTKIETINELVIDSNNTEKKGARMTPQTTYIPY